jgi:hypothetical protein
MIIQDINTLYTENGYSTINLVNKLRIYFIQNKPYFNPNKNRKIIEKFKDSFLNIKEEVRIRQVLSVSDNGKIRAHPSIKTSEDSDIATDLLKTHKPLENQEYFLSLNDSKTCYNDVQNINIILESKIKSYNPENVQIQNEIARG